MSNMMIDAFTYDAFLSHSSKDKAVVRPIAERLRGDGLKVWFDEWEIKPGDNIPAKIEEGLEYSRVLVFCMSANAFGSDWSQLEAGTFRFRDPLNKERRLIPLRLDDAPIKGSLAQFSYINWFRNPTEEHYANLLQACRFIPTGATGSSLFEQRVGESVTGAGISKAAGAPVQTLAHKSPGADIGTTAIQWEVSFVEGSSCHLAAGVAGTLSRLNGHHRECFPGDGTVILGTLDGAQMGAISSSRAAWQIPVTVSPFPDYARGFIAIGCLRYYGGLHSRRFDSVATIFINGRPVDRILLRIKPDGHSDYFCHIPRPEAWPTIPPFSECRTLYIWPLIRDHLLNSKWQSLEVEIDGYANWDIDYIGLVFQRAHVHGL